MARIDDTPRATYDGKPICDGCATPIAKAKDENLGILLRLHPRPVH